MIKSNRLIVLFLYLMLVVCLGVAASYSPLATIAGIIFFIWVWFCYKDTVYLLYTLVFLIPFRDIHIVSGFWVKNTLLLLLLIILIFKGLKQNYQKTERTKTYNFDKRDILLFIFMLSIMISLFWSYSNVSDSLYENIFTSVNYTITNIFLFIITKGFVTSKKELSVLFKIMLISILCVALLGVVESFFPNLVSLVPGMFSPYYYGRVSSTFDNPNYLGVFLAVGCSFWFTVFVYGTNKLIKILSFLALLLVLAVTILTYSRFALIIGILAMFFVVYFKLKSKISRIIVLIIVPVILYLTITLVLPFFLDYRISKVFEGFSFDGGIIQNQSDGLRLSALSAAYQAIKENPFGIGYGTFTHISSRYNSLGIDINTHNEYMRLWAELGLFGLLIFMFIVLIGIIRGYKKLKFTNSVIDAAFLSGLLTFVLGNFTLNSLEDIQLIGFFWVILGYMYSQLSYPEKNTE